MERYYQRKGDTTSRVEHEDLGRKGIHRVNAVKRIDTLSRKNFPVICPVNDHLREALDSQTFRLANKSSGYDYEVCRNVAKLDKRPQV